MRVNVREMGVRDRLANLELIIWGENLHAPLIERVVELPMDIYGGVVQSLSKVPTSHPREEVLGLVMMPTGKFLTCPFPYVGS